jgi:hypothetical protein
MTEQNETTETIQSQDKSSESQQSGQENGNGTGGGQEKDSAADLASSEQNADAKSVSEDDANNGDNADGDSGQEDSIEWSQKPPAFLGQKGDGSEKPANQADGETVDGLKKTIESKDAEISELKSKIEQYQGLDTAFEDPIIKTWTAHKLRHGSQASATLFLQELGQIKFVDNRSEEEKARAYYEAESKKVGLSGDLLERALEEDLDNFASLNTRERYEVLKKAEQLLNTTEVVSIESLEQKHLDEVNKLQDSNRKWIQKNTDLFTDFLNKVVQKGVYEGKPVDTSWRDRMLTAFLESRDVLNPRYMALADPDEKGEQLLYIPEVVSLVDSIEFRKENKVFFKKKVSESRVRNLGERAEQTEQAAIKSELNGRETPEDRRARELDEANRAAYGDKAKKG